MSAPPRGEPIGGPGARDLARWSLCFAAVLALHGGAALAVLVHAVEDEAAGLPAAIPIELAALPVAPSAAPAEDATPGPEQMQSDASPAEAAEAAAPEPSEDTEPAAKPGESAEAAVAEPPPEPPTASVPDLTPAPKPEATLAPRPEPQKLRRENPKPETRPREKPRERPLETRQPRDRNVEREKSREDARPRREPQRLAAAPATTAPASARSVAARAAAPMGNAGTSSSLPGWKLRLAAHLQRNKRYPSEAQASGQEGVATVEFTVDRSGRVTASRLARSSGVPSLDAETLALIRRAQPLPPPPADIPGTQFSFSVPFRYSMR